MLGGLIFSLRGTPIIDEGQEIGMTNGDFKSLGEIRDIESHNVDKMAKGLGIRNPWRWNLIRKTSRDNARTPMQWTGGEGAGFTTGTPWLQINKNHTAVNVETDMASEDSVHAFYKRLIAFRKATDVLRFGNFSERFAKGSVYVFMREYEGKRLAACFNFSRKPCPIPTVFDGSVALCNYPGDTAADAPLRAWEYRLIAL